MAFHLNNREAKRELKICNNGKLLPCCPTPTYLGVKLDRSLTFRHHLEALRKKLSTRVALLRQLAGSGWGAGAKTLRTAALSLVYSTAEYYAPVWCRSAHTRLIDSVLNGLKSRCPFVSAAQKLLDSLTESDIRAAQWMDYVWNMEYLKSASRLHAFIPRVSPKPLGMGLPRISWIKVNRLRTGLGRFHSSM